MAWFTAKNDQPRAFAAFSTDAGKTFAAPIRIDDAGTLGRVDLELLPDGSALVTIAGIAGSRSSGYPRAAVANGEVVFAWTESTDGGGLQVRTASAKHP